MDGLKINQVDTNLVYEASISNREFAPLKKKSIKDSVPFSNEVYDFSAINGEIYYEPRTLKYEFEMISENEDELERMKIRFHNFLLTQEKVRIDDPYTKGYYFEGTIEKVKIEEEIFKATFEVEIEAYPYMFAEEKVSIVNAFTTTESTIEIQCNSSHPVCPQIKADSDCVIEFENKRFAVSSSEIFKNSRIKLKPGLNTLSIKGYPNAGNVTIEYREEVF